MRLLASAGAALMLVVIVSSAFLRLHQAGFSCADWPACYGRIDRTGATTGAVLVARSAHRVAASAVGIVLLAALLIGIAQRPWLKRQIGIAALALFVALGLAALGTQFQPSASEIPSPAAMLANLGGGFALLALLWLLRLTTLPPAAARMPSWLVGAAVLGLVAIIGEVALGALVSAKFAALACPGFPTCGNDWPAGALLDSLDPFAPRVVASDGAVARPASLAALHWAHRVGASIVLVLGAAIATGLWASCRARRIGAALAALLVAQLSLGAAAVLGGFPLALVIAHNAVAALLLVVLVTATWTLAVRPPDAA